MTTIRARIVTSLTEILAAAVAEGWVVAERSWRETLAAQGRVAFVYHVGEDKRLESGGPEARMLATLHVRVAVVVALDEQAVDQSPGELIDECLGQLEHLLPLDEPSVHLAPLPVVDVQLGAIQVDRSSTDGNLVAAINLDVLYRHDSNNPSTIEGATP